ncbi:TIGR04219 family outer membrane beta-barrel protein [Gilvimarinus sp. SDUM040013]|uniref:TIGR04219 family outer membrane beta-barrel protein n=1 Tax=Gilvimarinus gilvus TaxID=3058038 RepID=A0ABU4S374_9GAMM|nr:TIGR04219 family outer membrane beta-barrel protein [Gilvimarinus sp. SDUM040013]MDO3386448.1 TIGR04219 family outer membrane beta-barrel protein [Gilvimarinus sp. SDUM040013]MDX6849714.1 TIGR04219 family outer membrane beta-barrel protein [Gilvimarinus sp. SDUM040013]
MKAIVTGLITSALMFTHATQADAIGVKGDAGIWRSDYSGDISQFDVSDLGFSEEDNQYFHLYVEHPIPLIPNARLSYADINSSTTFSTAGIDLAQARIDLSHVDATAYYELLDNWVNIDAGISLRKFDGKVNVDAGATDANLNLDDVLPMGYLLVEAELPFTGWSAGIEVNYTEFDDYTISDNTVKARYLFDSLINVGFEVGYRQLEVDLSKGFGIDLKLTGPFAGLALHF